MVVYGTFPAKPTSKRNTRRVFFFASVACALAAVVLVAVMAAATPRQSKWTELLPEDDEATRERKTHVKTFLDKLPERLRKMVDNTEDPCYNFHKWTCGSFEATAKIPASASSYKWSTTTDSNNMVKEVHELVEGASGRIHDYYAACMNTDLVEKLGTKPIQTFLDDINSISDGKSLARVLAKLHLSGVGVFFNWNVAPDIHDPTTNLLFLKKGGWRLPHPSMYKQETTDALSRRATYLTWIFTVLELVKSGRPGEIALNTWEMEKHLASYIHAKWIVPHGTKRPHRWTQGLLREFFPHFDWKEYFTAWGRSEVGETEEIIVLSWPGWWSHVDKMLGELPLQVVKDYLMVHTLFTFSPLLPAPFLENMQDFHNEMWGTSTAPPRWRKCSLATKGNLVWEVTQSFVNAHFPPSSKALAKRMVENVRDAFHADLQDVEWMSSSTKVVALEKLERIFAEVAYPDSMPVSTFTVRPDDYMHNYVRSRVWHNQEKMGWLDAPVVRKLWKSSPMAVNAYYYNGVNGIFIPVGILQHPFFNVKEPVAYNYGAIGSIMGHELTHGFDNHGRNFDPSGKKREWWDHDTISNFKERENCFVDLYDSFEIAGTNLDGQKTLGENIADTGGLRMAYHAFINDAVAQGHEADDSARRLFWTAYALTNCGVQRQRLTRLHVKTSVHSPDRFRIIGPVSQLEEFAQDFECPVGSPMNPVKRCELW